MHTRCPRCESELLIPQRSTTAGGGDVLVDLRCAECSDWTQVTLSRAQLAELDRAHIAGRSELLSAYERCVSESMEALAHCLGVALAEDLVGPDDFAPRRPALS
jgi:hypothetical protein